MQKINKAWGDNDYQDPRGETKVFLNVAQLFVNLGDGDANRQAESGQDAASAERNRDAHDAASPDGLRCEIGEDAAGQIEEADYGLGDGGAEEVIEEVGGLAEFGEDESGKTDGAAPDYPADALRFERGHFTAALEKNQQRGSVDYVAG